MKIRFKGWTALVTGASSGIGLAISRQLAEEVSHLILVARRIGRLETLKAEIQSNRPEITVDLVSLDLSQFQAIEEFSQYAKERNWKVDLLVNNAGVGDYGLFEEANVHKVKQVIDLNISALTYLTLFFLPEMVSRKQGAILNVSSIAGFIPVPQLAVYAATKAYVTSLSEALQSELRGTGVSVTALCPGPIPTEFNENAERSEPQSNINKGRNLIQISATQAAAYGLRAVRRQQLLAIPGKRVAVMMGLLRLLPRWLVRKLAGIRVQRP